MSVDEKELSKLQAENADLLEQNKKLQGDLQDLQLMQESIIAHGEAVEDELAEKNILLEKIQKRLNAELQEASHYACSILPPVQVENPPIDWRFVPSSELGGDSFGYHWLDKENFAIYLLDVCGHGVGAALLSVTAINVLRSGALRDVDMRRPEQVLGEMNNVFSMDKNNGMYLTLWYGVYNKKNRELHYATGGHPPAILLSPGRGGDLNVAELCNNQLVIGGFPDVKYESVVCSVPAASRLYVFSDGVYELRTPEGKMLAFADFVAMLKKLASDPSLKIDDLIKDLVAFQKVTTFEDDFSLMQIDLK